MINSGDTGFVSIADPACPGGLKLKGLVTELNRSNAEAKVPGLSLEDEVEVDGCKLLFVNIPLNGVVKIMPEGWKLNEIIPLRPWPKVASHVIDAYGELDDEPMTAASGSEIGGAPALPTGGTRPPLGTFGPPMAQSAVSGSAFRLSAEVPGPLGSILKGAAPLLHLGEDDEEFEEAVDEGPMLVGPEYPTQPLAPGQAAPIGGSAPAQPREVQMATRWRRFIKKLVLFIARGSSLRRTCFSW